MSVSDQKDIFGCDVGNGFGVISVLKDTKADPVAMFPAKYNLKAVGMPTSAYIVPPEGEKTEVFDGRSAYEKHKRESDKFIHAVRNCRKITCPYCAGFFFESAMQKLCA